MEVEKCSRGSGGENHFSTWSQGTQGFDWLPGLLGRKVHAHRPSAPGVRNNAKGVGF